jgi:hypothetical protein
MSRMWHNTRGSGLLSSALSVLVILGTSAAMAKSSDTPSPHRARDAIGAQARSADGVTSSVTAPEVGGTASGATAAAVGAERTGAGSGTSPRQGPVRTTTASCGGTVSSIGGNLPRAKDRAGISVAISRVRANCAREPQASGLLRALQRLTQHGRPGSPGHGSGHAYSHASGHGSGHANGHSGGHGNGHAGAGNPGQGHPNHGNSTTTGNAGGGGKGKGAGR